ncbi:hypothetical protein [Riemerella anatipestifer]|uniref:hypothetical protein n=1 Tax=Riemerella anatipestifer TaxID=34085 RepID=UPI00129D9493|nr:hypothetical protein [Riemerella anatipestifer]MRM83351.1 hypothetical protein [Riemerella anatipestifer]
MENLNTRESVNFITNVVKFQEVDNYMSDKNLKDVLNIVHQSVIEGYKNAKNYISKNEYEFMSKRHEANTYNTKIVAAFLKEINKNVKLSSRVKLFCSHSMIYFLVDRKFLMCFKAINNNDMVSNMLTGRHNNVMKVGGVSLNKRILDELAKIGIHRTPPLYYIGYHQPSNGALNIKCLRYFNYKPVFNLDLSEMFSKETEDISAVQLKTKIKKEALHIIGE